MERAEEIIVHKTSKRGCYGLGYRYCSKCAMFYLTNTLRCPYCGQRLRCNPRKYKKGVKRVDPSEGILESLRGLRRRSANDFISG